MICEVTRSWGHATAGCPLTRERGLCPAPHFRSLCPSPWGMESVRPRGHFPPGPTTSLLAWALEFPAQVVQSSIPGLPCVCLCNSFLVPVLTKERGIPPCSWGDVGGGCTCRCGVHMQCVRPLGAGCYLRWKGVHWEPGARGRIPPWCHILTGSFKDARNSAF